ncbi:MAG: glycosyltransferase [Flavobacteriales bacterium]|nr:glycosyltransferase [Flavobacteriales bacterium]
MFTAYFICILGFTSTAILIGYYLLIFDRIRRQGDVPSDGPSPPISVIICARNEHENLKKNIPSILAQDYPDYEVIIVDDASWDGTSELLAKWEHEHPILRVVTISEEQKRTEGKKMALTLGIKRAQHALLLLTDADCRPRTDRWIRAMSKFPTKDIVLGYGAYEKSKGPLNLLIRFDTWRTAVFYLGAALAGRAYMGVGRNLLYTRSLYEKTGGFRKHYHLIGGDDDLFVNHNSSAQNTGVVTNENGHTLSTPPDTWKRWFRQRRRHMSVSHAYSGKSKFFIGTYNLSSIIFYVSILFLFTSSVPWYIPLALFLIKTLIHLLISIYPARELKENEMVVLLPILEPVALIMDSIVSISAIGRRPKAWK